MGGEAVIEKFIPRSSNLDEVAYDSETQTMIVTFKTGQSWEYSGVPLQAFMGIQNAQSAGSYFFRNIRSVYSGVEV